MALYNPYPAGDLNFANVRILFHFFLERAYDAGFDMSFHVAETLVATGVQQCTQCLKFGTILSAPLESRTTSSSLQLFGPINLEQDTLAAVLSWGLTDAVWRAKTPPPLRGPSPASLVP